MKCLVAVLMFGFLLVPVSSFAINKCIDAEGNVSFQDQPCDEMEVTEAILIPEQKTQIGSESLSGSDTLDFEPLIVTVPGVGDVVLFAFNWWQASIVPSGPGNPPLVKMKSRRGESPLSMSLTFFPNTTGQNVTIEQTKQTVKQIGARFVATSVEQAVRLKRLETTLGPAVLANFNERKYHNQIVPIGEYSSITVGQINHTKLVVAVSILSNGVETSAHEDALNVIGNMAIIPE